MPEGGPPPAAPVLEADEAHPTIEVRVVITPPTDDVDLETKLATLPPRPGVYLLRDANDKVLYVGKAKSLRSRVRSYFRGGDERAQVTFLVGRVARFETLVTANEKEALILENNLIKQYKPRYNIRLKDDKSYVSVKIDEHHEWPRLLVTRKIMRDGSRYLGPFSSAWSVRETLDTIRKIFPIRNCSDTVFRNRARPCIEYQIKRCPGPCCLPVDRVEYTRNLAESVDLLEGKNQQLVRALTTRMSAASEGLRFEEAARASVTSCAPSRRPSNASKRSLIGAATRTSSASIARAASSRSRSCSCAPESSPATRPTPSTTSSSATTRSWPPC